MLPDARHLNSGSQVTRQWLHARKRPIRVGAQTLHTEGLGVVYSDIMLRVIQAALSKA